jgi:hypothetical protein
MDCSLLTPKELLNIDCDKAADTALVDGAAAVVPLLTECSQKRSSLSLSTGTSYLA